MARHVVVIVPVMLSPHAVEAVSAMTARLKPSTALQWVMGTGVVPMLTTTGVVATVPDPEFALTTGVVTVPDPEFALTTGVVTVPDPELTGVVTVTTEDGEVSVALRVVDSFVPVLAAKTKYPATEATPNKTKTTTITITTVELIYICVQKKVVFLSIVQPSY